MLLVNDPRSADSLEGLEVPSKPRWPARHSRWTPIAHAVVARQVIATAERWGLHVSKQAWGVSPSGHDLFGAIDFDDRHGDWPGGVVPSIAVRHSNQGRYSLQIALGARVVVCSNGMFLGEVGVRCRHLPGVAVDELVEEGLTEFRSAPRRIERLVRRLRDTPVYRRDFEHILVEAGRRGVLPWGALGKVDQAREQPCCHDFARPHAWAAYNAFTEVIKARAAGTQLDALRRVDALFAEPALAKALAA